MDGLPSSTSSAVTRHRSSTRFDIWNEVPLVPQTTGMSCWAAAAAMLVGWRERISVDPEEVARGAGRWEAYREGLEPEDVDALGRTWGLHVVGAPRVTPEGIRAMLDEHGPLWLGEASPGLHSIVVAGIYGDGSDDGTFVRINDPWPVDHGERYALSVRELRRNFDAATDVVGAHAQLLHSGGRGSSVSSHHHRSITTRTTRKDSTMDTFPHFGRPNARALGTVAAGERYLRSSTLATDPLASHGGSGENLFLRWNALDGELTAIDVVVHLHGYSSRAPDRAMLEGKVSMSGASLVQRTRPTLVIVPRGRKITASERRSNPRANPGRYTFPGLLAGRGQGLEGLVAASLAWLAGTVLGRAGGAIAVDRLILTAHSGGGSPLNGLLSHHADRRVCNPHEVHVFDATYGAVAGIESWLAQRIASDRTGALRPDMRSQGGGMRLLYRPGGTESGARTVATTLRGAGMLGGATYLEPYYRVERSGKGHSEIPRDYGPVLLGDVAVDLADVQERIGGAGGRYGTPLGLFHAMGFAPAGWDPDGYGVAQGAPAERSLEEIHELGAEVPDRDSLAAKGQSVVVTALAAYADDAHSPDLRHVQAWPGVNGAFSFGGDQLRTLARANHFPMPTSGLVLFGLRGCTLVSGADGAFHASVDLDESIPDHIHARCVIGVWDVDDDRIAVFRGSTVPNEHHMGRQVRSGGSRANMLLTGFHTFRIGRHRSRYDGMFIEGEERVIVRSNDNLVFETSDPFMRYRPGDNLHPSFEPQRAGSPLEFSSAGCLTIPGNATSPDQHSDPADGSPGWATFRERAGLTRGAAPAAENGREFKMILLTGREGRIASNGEGAALARLRFGSRGPAVEALQDSLIRDGRLAAGDRDGTFGPGTAMAWIGAQQARDGGRADGIVTPVDARAGNFSITPGGHSIGGHRRRW